uniref:NADH-ubiquinone oxidoreductase chain 2 n=1 Tax=Elateroidea sp. 1 KM-2017 TaxID=2219423 RepID=A0A346RJW2_9COLE|nr:NADH dehydrogenase subunit 2 [Elateroidea sp. 1 KM-2017]
MMFLILLFSSTLIAISSYSWMGMWIGLEINLLSIIPLMYNNNNMSSAEASIKYFITQAIASSAILLSIILLMKNVNFISNMEFSSSYMMIMNSALLTKMGMAPFHFWFPEIMEGLSWTNCLIILTWQKIMPMTLLMLNWMTNNFMMSIIVISLIISSIMSMNQISLRKILAYSSINNMSWMMTMIMMMKTTWMVYFIVYSLMTTMLVVIFNNYKIYFLNQLFMLNLSIPTKIMFNLNFLSIMGMPPLLGFMPKWLTIQILIENNFFLLTSILIICTLAMIFIYLRMMIPSILININQMNWMKDKTINSFTISLYNFITLTSLISVTFIFNWM